MNEIFTMHNFFYVTLLAPLIITILAIRDKGDFKKHGPRELWVLFILLYILGFQGGFLLK